MVAEFSALSEALIKAETYGFAVYDTPSRNATTNFTASGWKIIYFDENGVEIQHSRFGTGCESHIVGVKQYKKW